MAAACILSKKIVQISPVLFTVAPESSSEPGTEWAQCISVVLNLSCFQ